MKIVIDIPEDVYTRLYDNGIQDNEISVNDICKMVRVIRKGIPLKAIEQNPCEDPKLISVRQELLDRGDEMVSFRQLVERFDKVEEVFKGIPWNLKQIYSNFNILIGEKPSKWVPEDVLNHLIGAEVLDKIRAELHATAEIHEDGDFYLREEWIDEIFDKYTMTNNISENHTDEEPNPFFTFK